jgi:hypothetical protein
MIMARTLATLMALVALLSLSACNNITGSDAGSTSGTTVGGKDRSPVQLDSPDVMNPEEGEGGGSGSVTHPLNRIRIRPQQRDRDREEVSPVEGGGGGGESGSGVEGEKNPRRRGEDVVTPAN